MTSDPQSGFGTGFDERERELERLLDDVSYELSEARHRSLSDPVACAAALDRALKRLTDARALAAAEAADR